MIRTACFFKLNFKGKEILLIIFRHFGKFPANNLYTNNRFLTTFETFAETTRIDNSVLEYVHFV